MSRNYEKPMEHWKNIFGKMEVKIPSEFNSGNEDLNNGVKWLVEGSESVLDFGCGHGTLMFCCGFLGVKRLYGIDMCEEAIAVAKQRAAGLNNTDYRFEIGSISDLSNIEDESFDSMLISNVLDNLYPEDAEKLLKESYRILKKGGKILIKLNPLLSKEVIEEYEIKIIEDNVLDDGMILWNNNDKQWKEFIEKYFFIEEYSKIYYKEYETENRLYKAIKK